MPHRFFADFISVLSRTINPHDEDECNEMEHFNKKRENKEETETSSSSSHDDQKKRRMSHVDIMFIDKEEEEDEDKKQNGDKISPGALVDIMA